MNRCPNCSVNVYQKVCPLCGRVFDKTSLTQMDYPSYIIIVKKRVFIYKLFLFITISAILITAFINTFTYSASEKLWSLTVCASLGMATCLLYVLKSKKINIGGKILRLFACFSVFIIIIDISNGFYRWSTTYIIPFATVSVALLFAIIALTKKNNFKEYFGYLLAIAFISICPIALYLFNLTDELWTSLLSTLVCIIIALAFYIFAEQSLKDELRKRFHS